MQGAITIQCPYNHQKQVSLICFNTGCQEYRQACIQCVKNKLHQNHIEDLEEWDEITQVIEKKSEKLFNFKQQIEESWKQMQSLYSQFIQKIDQIHNITIQNLTLNDEFIAKEPKLISDLFFKIVHMTEVEEDYVRKLKKKLEKFSAFLNEMQNQLLLDSQQEQRKILEDNEMEQAKGQSPQIIPCTKLGNKQLDRLVLKIEVKSQNLNYSNQLKKSQMNINCRDSDTEQINIFKKLLFNLKPNDWLITTQLINTISVPYPGQFCVVCQKNIFAETKQYYSPFKQEHICESCAEYQNNQKIGFDRFKYKDTLIFINGPLKNTQVLYDIPWQFVGKNLQSYKSEQDEYQDFICNGCRASQPKGIRYIAVHILPKRGFIDYCSNCFLKLKNKESWQAQEIIENNKQYGVTGDDLLVRILFNSNGYYSF